MGIHFTKERWGKIEESYTKWWARTLERPIIKVTVKNAFAPDREKPDVPLVSQLNCNDFSCSPEEIIDAIDYELSQCEFLGDAFPFVNMAAFGPSSLAGFCGAEMDNTTGSVWYFPKEKVEIENLSIKYDPENKWAKRIKEIYQAGKEKWGDLVLMSMPDLGGFQDVAATFLGSEQLIFDMMDEPEEVKRLQREIYEAFTAAYDDFSNVLGKGNPGYSDWSGLYSKKPSYILQDDFAYMISPQMFNEFALPEIKYASEKYENIMYHLDGVGNLNHLDSLIRHTNIKAVQWVYGAGQPSARSWMEVYEKLDLASKNMEIVGDLEDFEVIADKFPKGIYYHVLIDDKLNSAFNTKDYKDCLNDYNILPLCERGKIEKLLKKWNIE